eukprot:GHRR01006253.1.p1 GENE.GHRR01006253.1~~GHRR01006253.1.p1  ORF type:complete len:506 (+),score=202.95 GHRR01006253.1:927-2444(+)
MTATSSSGQLVSSNTAAAVAAAGDEPDFSNLTVMQRYHARRKLAMQRMEREVEEKMALLSVLEQENRKLKWKAHIMENMLLDFDKQLEVMSSSDAAPDAQQWLTLLGMGPSTSGHNGKVTRTVHKMLEGAGTIDVSTWTAQECRIRWSAFVEQLRPWVEQAEAAQRAYRAEQQQHGPQEQISGCQTAGSSRRPRRAAAAIAAAVIQQEAADVFGVLPAHCNTIPEPPAPAVPSAFTDGATAAAGVSEASQADDKQNVLRRQSSGSSGGSDMLHWHPSGECSLTASHLTSVEGVPQLLLQQIEDLVLQNFYWLLAMMTTQPVLTYEFICMDCIEGTKPLPAPEHKLWADVVTRAEFTLDQLQECSTCLHLSRRCMDKVHEERAAIQQSMQCGVESEMHTHLSSDVLQLNSRDAAVERMRANMCRESVVRNMVGFYCINVFSVYQLAKISVASAPWFCMAWRVVGAMDAQLTQLQRAGREPSLSSGSNGSHSTRGNTRSSTRSGFQR